MAKSIRYGETADKRSKKLAKELINGLPKTNSSKVQCLISVSRQLIENAGINLHDKNGLKMRVDKEGTIICKPVLYDPNEKNDEQIRYTTNIIRFPKQIVKKLSMTTKSKYLVKADVKRQVLMVNVLTEKEFSDIVKNMSPTIQSYNDKSIVRNKTAEAPKHKIKTDIFSIDIPFEFKTNQLYSGYTNHHVKYLEQVRAELELQTGTHITLPDACGIWRYMSFCNPSKNKLSGRFNIPDETLSVEISKFLTGRKPYTKMR